MKNTLEQIGSIDNIGTEWDSYYQFYNYRLHETETIKLKAPEIPIHGPRLQSVFYTRWVVRSRQFSVCSAHAVRSPQCSVSSAVLTDRLGNKFLVDQVVGGSNLVPSAFHVSILHPEILGVIN